MNNLDPPYVRRMKQKVAEEVRNTPEHANRLQRKRIWKRLLMVHPVMWLCLSILIGIGVLAFQTRLVFLNEQGTTVVVAHRWTGCVMYVRPNGNIMESNC